MNGELKVIPLETVWEVRVQRAEAPFDWFFVNAYDRLDDAKVKAAEYLVDGRNVEIEQVEFE